MRPADTHLTPQELESLLFGAADSNNRNADGASAQSAQQHLRGCAVCQSVADRYRNAESALKGLITQNNRAVKAPTRGNDCPAEETWLRLAAGLISAEEAARYVTHAAQCDWCGPLLKESMEDLAQDATAEEQGVLANLESASAGWQRELGKKLAAGSANAAVMLGSRDDKPAQTQQNAGAGWLPKFAWASAGLAVITLAIWVGIRLPRTPDVNQLLTQAYKEQRSMELRIPGASYGPTREQRGGASNNRSAAFYEALRLLAAQRNRRKHDPEWLRAEGLAELMDGEYQTSVTTLDEAHRLSSQDDNIAIDLASALLQRATNSSQGEEDSLRAINLLREVTARNPQNAVAWFNLAIACERMHLFKEALQTWDSYLKIDSSSNWAAEARERRDKLQKRLEEQNKASNQPLAGPNQVASLYQSNVGPKADVLDKRIESYLTVIVAPWGGVTVSTGDQRTRESGVSKRSRGPLPRQASEGLSEEMSVQE